MSKRFSVFVLITVAAAATAGAASDETCTRNVIVERRALRAPAGAVPAAGTVTTKAAETTPVPLPEGVELLVARIGPDGKPVLACVDSAEALRKFLESPVEKLARGAKEK